MSFKENFEKEDKDSLDYDDSAFYYYGFSMLVIVAVPLTYKMVVKHFLYGEKVINHSLKNC